MTYESLGDFGAAIVQKWTCLEEHEDVREALVDDDLMVMTEEVYDEAQQSSKTTESDSQMNSDEVKEADTESIPVPSVARIAQMFSEVEALSSRTGVCSASYHLRKAKQALISARRDQESKRSRQILVADVLK
ncbi:hypothetical protein FGB62_59g035 [Gracilaria domingensis]|nr:hypothetical protein FGB62_59g035 [Gracilaria domingensis]